MLHRSVAIPLLLWAQICGGHGAAAASQHSLAGPLLGNIIVASLAATVTLACAIVAVRMLVHPGELDPNHPKRRILQPDR